MVRTITIPDLHGKDDWLQVDPDKYDKIIFLGDYVDAPHRNVKDVKYMDSLNRIVLVDEKHGRDNSEILYNLSNIIAFKDKYPDKVELLLGNHELPYLYHIKNKSLQKLVQCAGFRHSMQNELAQILYSNILKFKIAYRLGNVMWSHAGVTPSAYLQYFSRMLQGNFDIFADELNRWFILNEPDLFRISEKRGGYDRYGSIFWADKSEWRSAKYNFPFMQIIGHSPVDSILYLYEKNILSFDKLDRKVNVVFADVLHKKSEFYELEVFVNENKK